MGAILTPAIELIIATLAIVFSCKIAFRMGKHEGATEKAVEREKMRAERDAAIIKLNTLVDELQPPRALDNLTNEQRYLAAVEKAKASLVSIRPEARLDTSGTAVVTPVPPLNFVSRAPGPSPQQMAECDCPALTGGVCIWPKCDKSWRGD